MTTQARLSEVGAPAGVPEVVHAVCTCQDDRECRLALCGTDCTDLTESDSGRDQWCAVCLDMMVSLAGCERCGAGR